MTTPPVDLDRIEALLAQSEPGYSPPKPWQAPDGSPMPAYMRRWHARRLRAAAAEKLRNAVPAMVAELRALRARASQSEEDAHALIRRFRSACEEAAASGRVIDQYPSRRERSCIEFTAAYEALVSALTGAPYREPQL